MNRRELVNAVAAHTGLEPRDVDKALRGTTEVIGARGGQGGSSHHRRLRRVRSSATPRRARRNPATGKPVKGKVSKKAKITLLKGLRTPS